MKKLSIFLFVLLAISACTTPTIVQYERTGTVENIQQTKQHWCLYKLTVWCETEGRYYDVFTTKIYEPGSTIILINKNQVKP